MKAIFLFVYKLMMVIRQSYSKQPVQTQARAKASCLGVVYSFEAHVMEKKTIHIVPDIQQPYNTRQTPAPTPQRPPRNTRSEWQVWCENNKMLFSSTA